jgi:hypothetical protein
MKPQKGISTTVVVIIVVIVVAILLGGYFSYRHFTNHTPNNTPASTASNVTLSDIDNATYTISGTQAQFTDGKFHPERDSTTSADQGLNAVISSYAFGDINGDGKGDAAVVIEYGMGARDARTDTLQIILSTNDKPETKSVTIPGRLGDALATGFSVISINSSGLISIQLATSSTTTTRTYHYVNDTLVESVSINQIPGWNTYDNFGIVFQYPNTKAWGYPQENIYGSNASITLGANNLNAFSVSVTPYANIVNGPQTFAQVVKNASTNNSSQNSNYVVTNITADGMQGKEISHTYTGSSAGPIYLYDAIFPFNGTSWIEFGSDSTFLTKDTFDKLLSTFKQDPNSIPKTDPKNSWLMYKGSQMQFEYPTTFNTDYASLSLQTIILGSGDSNIDTNGCYAAYEPNGQSATPTKIQNNGMTFCLTQGGDVGAGQAYYDYYYATNRNGIYYVIRYSVHTPNGCGAYENSPDINAPGNEKYKDCENFLSNDYNTVVVKSIQDSIATLTFTK